MNTDDNNQYINNLPKVSIIVANFNNGQFLNQCLNSINRQDYEKIEIVIIDDGSTDDSSKIIDKFIFKPTYDLITYKFSSNVGGGIAKKKGLELATGFILN